MRMEELPGPEVTELWDLPVERRVSHPTLRAQFDFLTRAGAVQRYHTETVLRPQTVAAHSFNVAWWCYLLQPDGRVPSALLLMAAIAHDIEEHISGDIPAPTKKSIGGIAAMEAHIRDSVELPDFCGALLPDEAHLLKMADVLDGLAYCVRERQLGNHTLEAVWRNYTAYYATQPHNPRAEALFTRLKELYAAAK